MQRVRLIGRTGDISLLGEKAFLRRNVFKMEGHGKRNGVPCITAGDSEQEEVMKLEYFVMNGGCQYIESAVAANR
jgi:hypothetical protein